MNDDDKNTAPRPEEPPDVFDGVVTGMFDAWDSLADGVPGVDQMEHGFNVLEQGGVIPKTPPQKEFYNEKIEASIEGQQTGLVRYVSVGGKLVNSFPKGDYHADTVTGASAAAYGHTNSNPVPDGMAYALKVLTIAYELFHGSAGGTALSNMSVNVMLIKDRASFYYYRKQYGYVEEGGAAGESHPDVDVVIPFDIIIPKGSVISIFTFVTWGGGTAIAPSTRLDINVTHSGYLFKEPLDLGVGDGVGINVDTAAEWNDILTRQRW